MMKISAMWWAGRRLSFLAVIASTLMACSTGGIPPSDTGETAESEESAHSSAVRESRGEVAEVIQLGDGILFGPAGGVTRNCTSSFSAPSRVLQTELFDPAAGKFINLALPVIPENQELRKIIGCVPAAYDVEPAAVVTYLTEERVTGLTPRRQLLNVALYEAGDHAATQVRTFDLGQDFDSSDRTRSYGDVIAVEFSEEVHFLDSKDFEPLWTLSGDQVRTIGTEGIDALAHNHQYVLMGGRELRDPRTGSLVMQDIESRSVGLFYKREGSWVVLTPEGEFKKLPDSLANFIGGIGMGHVTATFSGDYLIFTGLKFAAINLTNMEIPVSMDYEEFESTGVARTRVGMDGTVYFSGSFNDSCSIITLPSLEDKEISCATPVVSHEIAGGWTVIYNEGISSTMPYTLR